MNESTGAAAPTLDISCPSDNEVRMTRTFDAPRALVWEAMSKPEHVRNWYGFRGTTMPVCEMEMRVGGKWRFVSIAPGGEEVEFYGEYREIVEPERVVYTEIFAPFPDTESIVTTVLTERDGVTMFSCTAWYPSKEVRDMVLASGMETGAAESYERLAEVVASLR